MSKLKDLKDRIDAEESQADRFLRGIADSDHTARIGCATIAFLVIIGLLLWFW